MFKSSKGKGKATHDAVTRRRTDGGEMGVGAQTVIQASYFVAAALFILGLKRMSSPVTARGGIVWAGVGMLVATLITFLWPEMHNYALMTVAIAIGGVIAWVSGKRVAMADMPQMIALYNGMGGGAAGAIAAVELFSGEAHGLAQLVLGVLGGIIGAVSFAGSLIAFGKLQGLIKRSFRFRGQNFVNLVILAATVLAGAAAVIHAGADTRLIVTALFVLALVLGLTMTLPIGGADMPVVISLYNALTGLAVAFEGFVLDNAAMIIAGTVVGSAGTLLTQLMAKAMNRSLANVLFSGFGETSSTAATGPGRRAEGDRHGRRRGDARVLRESHRRAGLRDGGRASSAQSLGALPSADRARRHREVRDPSGRRAHAGPYERAACRSRRAVRPDLR